MTQVNSEDQIHCHSCKKALDIDPNQKIFKSEECPYCYADLRCCKMCSFYDPSAYNECREPSAQRVLEKEKANFCDFFKLQGAQSEEEKKENLLSAADSLFKK
ncbi:MAG: hypothetical protein ACPGJV_06540 [Bacteriovoracaceae bacterium]